MARMRLWCLLCGVFVITSAVQGQTQAPTKSETKPAANVPTKKTDGEQPVLRPVPRQAAAPQDFYNQDIYPVDMNEFRKQRMYPYEEKDRIVISQTKGMHDEALTFRLPFFGFAYRYIWINQDGYVSFNYGPKKYTPDMKFPILPENSFFEQDPSLIAIWLARQEQSKNKESGLFLKVVNIGSEKNRSLAERLVLDFQDGMIGSGDFRLTHAIIVSWVDMRVASAMGDQTQKNTYQLVLGTDEKRTYVMFNYDKLEWSSSQDVYGGLKHTQAFIGFNAGNTTRTYEFKPFSRESRILDLASLYGYGNKLKGRYFFQIDEEIWPGTCIDKELEPNLPDRMPLTFFPRYGNMLGGTVVNITGPCLKPKSRIRCRFETLAVDGVYRDTNHASCIAPKSPFLKYHGYIDLSVEVDEKVYFYGRYYVQPPDMVEEEVVVDVDRVTEEHPTSIAVKWNRHKLYWNPNSPVMLTLWGYRESMDLYPSLEYIETISLNPVQNGKEYYVIDTENFKDYWNSGKQDITFGFIAVNLTVSPIPKINFDPTIWSPPIPLAWYFRSQWEKVYGSNWKKRYCKNWFQNERDIERFAITVPRCPCTMKQAMLDIGRFTPDKHCNIIDKKCDIFNKKAVHCVRSGRPAVATGSAQTCCYDDYGELLQTADTMYGGRPARASMYGKHPFQTRMMIPTLSHWVYDIVPFFHCCKWADGADDSETCQMYNYWRTSQDCSMYYPPAVGSVYGDPHFTTFDGIPYTFNGKGEYVLVRANSNFSLDVQARFEQIPKKSPDDHPTNATYLAAIAAGANHSATVEIRLRPPAARWRYHTYVIVDKEYVFFWDRSLQMQYFKGVTLFQPAGIQNMSHIIAMFDNGAGFQVKTDRDHMSVHVFLPRQFRNKTGGLLGRYSGIKEDDFSLPDGNPSGASFASKSHDIHDRFGKKWRLTQDDKPYIGKSLFMHTYPMTWATYDEENFKPNFLESNELTLNNPVTEKLHDVCADSIPCRYDYLSTRDADYAKITLRESAEAAHLNQVSQNKDMRCPALPKPVHGRKSENRYYLGTSVIFSCEEGYRLVGHEVRRCREDGLWSWGHDPECVSVSKYNSQIAGVTVAIIIPVVFFVAIAIGCYVFKNRKRDSHYTGERGAPSRAVIEMTKRTQRNSTGPISDKPKIETEA